ncbi:MAG: type II toxin-antitoxin system Phd/YefM family antitoxin [Deltaproteobacteria bacterium]|nr:type II toxin-antitoxin system Phd/YefM family antitoxin [Deltaproteobacteria bacterium]
MARTSARALTTSEIREDFADTLNRVAYGKERIVLERHGKQVAALIPIEDLSALEEIEDRHDSVAARRVLARVAAKKEKLIPWSEARKKLKL